MANFINEWFNLILNIIMLDDIDVIKIELEKLIEKSFGYFDREHIRRLLLIKKEIADNIEEHLQGISNYILILSIYLAVNIYDGDLVVDDLIMLEFSGYDGTYGNAGVVDAYNNYALRRINLSQNGKIQFPILEEKRKLLNEKKKNNGYYSH